MSDDSLRISRLLGRTGGDATAPRRAVVRTTARGSVACYEVRRESRDARGRRIVERWTESAPRG